MRSRLISGSLIYFLLVMVSFPFYPGKAQAEEQLSLSGLTVVTKTFRPYKEKGEFSFFLSQSAQISAEIQDEDFSLVRTLALMKPGTTGKNILEWDGKDENKIFVQDDKYTLSITVMADDGASAILSRNIEIDFEDPEGIKFKDHISQIEGKKKKQHIRFNQEKILKLVDWPAGDCILGTIFLFIFPLIALPSDLIDRNTENRTPHVFYYGYRDSKEVAEINREIDEYNADIDAEIKERNKAIDRFNQRVKDTVTIRMELMD